MSGWTRFNQPETTDAIASIEVDELLASLVEKNLVVREESTGRYSLLETIRDYGRAYLEMFGEAETIRNRHLDYFLALAEQAEQQMKSMDQQSWLDRLETEHDNMRAALAWSSEGAEAMPVVRDTERGLRLAAAISQFWEVRGHLAEGRDYLRTILAQKDFSRTPSRAKALNAAGNLAYDQADYLAARKLHEESLAIKRELGDRSGIARSLGNLGNIADDQEDYPAARALFDECLAIQGELGDRWGIAASLDNLGNVAFDQANYQAARALHEESLAIRRELGDRRGIAFTLGNLGFFAFREGDYQAARVHYRESMAINRELGDRMGIAETLGGQAPVTAALGQPDRAACLWGAAARLREEMGSPLPASEQALYVEQAAAARAALDDDVAFNRAWQEGRELTLEQAISLAMEES